MAAKLYVGNLSFQTTQQDLEELFGQAGQVQSVNVITDRDTGAVVAEVRGDRVTVPLDGTPESTARLWADARTIAGVAAKLGRPPGSPVTDDAIWRAVIELRNAGRPITLDSIAANSGTFTYDQLRYYFRRSGRHLADYR